MNKIQNNPTQGWINGFIGVLIFSGSLPATRLAVMDFNPTFLTVARATIAGLFALALLLLLKEKRPDKAHLIPLIIVSMGVVIGFPLLTAFALQTITSAHSLVFLALLPLSTAIFGVIRGKEKPQKIFWVFSIIGSLLIMAFALSEGSQANLTGDLLMVAAIIVCGLGYAEGAQLSKTLGGWQVICWALALSLPFMLLLMIFNMPASFTAIRMPAWLSLLYVSIFSMLIGFIFWYRGLAQGGIASVGQLQLLQPFFGLSLAAWLLNEPVSIVMIICTIGVIACVAGSKKFAKPQIIVPAHNQPQ